MKKTNLQILVGALRNYGLTASEIDDLILENFDDQNGTEYTVEGEIYFLFDKYEVEDILRTQFDKELEEFKKVIKYNFEEYDRHVNYENIIDEKLENTFENEDYIEIEGYTFIDKRGDYYIYKEDND